MSAAETWRQLFKKAPMVRWHLPGAFHVRVAAAVRGGTPLPMANGRVMKKQIMEAYITPLKGRRGCCGKAVVMAGKGIFWHL